MRRETIRKLLRNYKNVVFTKKAEIRCVQRGIDKKLVEDNVLNPRPLIYVIDEGQPTPGCGTLIAHPPETESIHL